MYPLCHGNCDSATTAQQLKDLFASAIIDYVFSFAEHQNNGRLQNKKVKDFGKLHDKSIKIGKYRYDRKYSDAFRKHSAINDDRLRYFPS